MHVTPKWVREHIEDRMPHTCIQVWGTRPWTNASQKKDIVRVKVPDEGDILTRIIIPSPGHTVIQRITIHTSDRVLADYSGDIMNKINRAGYIEIDLCIPIICIPEAPIFVTCHSPLGHSQDEIVMSFYYTNIETESRLSLAKEGSQILVGIGNAKKELAYIDPFVTGELVKKDE